jgi:hypothetical protein
MTQDSAVVWSQKFEDRILTISRDVYDGEIAEWNRADVSAAFKGR